VIDLVSASRQKKARTELLTFDRNQIKPLRIETIDRLVGPPDLLGSLWRIRFAGPVFRFGRNPVLGLCFGLEVPDVGVRAVPCLHGNEPTAAFYHFGLKKGDRLRHAPNILSVLDNPIPDHYRMKGRQRVRL
jgi:hypothetical protein